MKNLFYLIIAFFSVSVMFQSCSEDGDWEDVNGGQFGFTIDRDTYFIEKSVGEANQMKFNVVSNYNYSTIPMKFKFTSSLNGTLSLNGNPLQQNVEYTLTNKENIFSYVGNVQGTHNISIIARNDKGISKEEKFTLEYGISEFAHTFTGGTADIYQGDVTPYLMKITPSSGQPNTGFEIKFNSYNGDIKLNGVAVQTGQFYPLPNIDNFTVGLATNQVGQGALDYTIKNATVQKNYNIQQTVIARKIVIESMNVNSLNVLPNSQMSLIGVVKKTPVTTNSTVKYKTWISASSNNNINGIQNTNNTYIPFALGANGAFNINFNAIETGTYTYNIQFQDEYGNESEIKSFSINVQSQVWFDAGQGAVFQLKLPTSSQTSLNFIAFLKTFKAHSGGSSTIVKIKYTCTMNSTLGTKVFNFEENYTGGNALDYNNTIHGAGNQVIFPSIPNGFNLTDANLKVEVINSNNQSATIIIPATVQTM